MADAEKSTFEKMGDNAVTNGLFNDRSGSGASSKYTMTQPRDAGSASGDAVKGAKGNRSASLIHEANGPRCYVQETIDYPNSAERGNVGRNVKPVRGGFRQAKADAEGR